MSRVVVSGALANKPFNGGNAWTRMSWVAGFQRLGFEVSFVEEIAARDCVDAAGQITTFENSVNLAWFREALERFGIGHAGSLVFENGEKVFGVPPSELARRAPETALLFNISGHLTHAEIKSGIGCKVYYDDDPGFTQFWEAEGNGGVRLEGHDFYFTIGENIGTPDCAIPVHRNRWRHTRAPVVLDHWPFVRVTRGGAGSAARKGAGFDRFTTVASWRGAYGAVEFQGKSYGVKAHEFRRFVELPRRTGREFEIALQIDPSDAKDLENLRANGWRIADPVAATGTMDAFQRYVQASDAEFSVAQGVYVHTNSGWFSDRTVRYLASGKPALVQDTGFGRHLPVGEGLLAFRTIEEAIDGVESIIRDYSRHAMAARAIAEDHFDSDKIISKLASEIDLELPRAMQHVL
jgi:hypothetical protein